MMDSNKDPMINCPGNQTPTVILNIGGVRHETTWNTLRSRPGTKLCSQEKMAPYFRSDKDDYYFDRSPRLFESILNLYRVGELHMEKSICARELVLELEFWEIDPSALESCCWLQYQSQCDANVTRKKFEVKSEEKFLRKQQETAMLAAGCGGCRVHVWAFLNDPHSSKWAMAWAVWSMLVLFLSIFTLCASTSPAFKTNLTLAQYAEYYNVQPSTLVEVWSNDYSDYFNFEYYDYNTDEQYGSSGQDDNGSEPFYDNQSRKKRDLNESFDMNRFVNVDHLAIDLAPKESDNSLTKRRNAPTWTDNNHGAVSPDPTRHTSEIPQGTEDSMPIQEHRLKRSVASTPNATRNTSQYQLDSLLGAPNIYLETIDMACYAFFALEVCLRFVFCPSKRRFFSSVLDILDILLVAIFVAEIVINSQSNSEAYRLSIIDSLYIFRVLRIFRIFRLSRHHKGLEVLVHTVKASLSEILLLFMFLLIGVLFFGSLIYFTDHDETHFKSIGHSFWWAIITMTTVGYGDLSPTTAGGKVVGTICAVCGVLLIAFTVPIIVNNFMMFYDLVEYGKVPTRDSTLAQRPQTGRTAKVADGPQDDISDIV